MKIGVLGGTFDPPHLGHLAIAETCRNALSLDEVMLLPSYQNPLKKEQASAPPRARMEMLRLTMAGHEGLSTSDIEITRAGKSYAVDTITELQMVRPGEYWFIMGTDTLRHLGQWKQPERLIKMCRLAVVVRLPQTEQESLSRLSDELRASIDVVPIKPIEISSTEIRDRLAAHHDVSAFLASGVERYIRQNKLYGT